MTNQVIKLCWGTYNTNEWLIQIYKCFLMQMYILLLELIGVSSGLNDITRSIDVTYRYCELAVQKNSKLIKITL